VLVLGVIGLLGYLPWAALGGIAVVNGLPEIGISALIVLLVVAALRQIRVGRKKGSSV